MIADRMPFPYYVQLSLRMDDNTGFDYECPENMPPVLCGQRSQRQNFYIQVEGEECARIDTGPIRSLIEADVKAYMAHSGPRWRTVSLTFWPGDIFDRGVHRRLSE